MANTRPTPVSFLGGIRLCFLLLFCPGKFQVLQEKDNERLSALDGVSIQPEQREHPALIVRRAFFSSLFLVSLSGVSGFVAGNLWGKFGTCSTSDSIAWLQILGACALLWGTLFIRGWEIQTHGGVTLTERVNQWIYRALYCIGTAILVFSLAWPQCPAANNAVERDAPQAVRPSP